MKNPLKINFFTIYPRYINMAWAKFFCLVLLFSFSCGEKEEEQTYTEVTSTLVKEEQVRFSRTYPAAVVALEEVDLRADVVGYVTRIHIEEGQQVKKGTLMYTIDQTRYLARKQQAESAVAIAEANYDRVSMDVNRYQKLKEEDAIATQILDNALVDLRNAQETLNSAKSDLENARIDLDYASIRAPFDGTVGFSQVRIGTLVSPGETLLNTISKDDPIGVDFFPEEQHLWTFQELFRNENVEVDSIFQLLLPGNRAYPFTGKIETLDRAVDRNTGTFQVRLRFPNPDNMLRPGLSSTLKVLDEKSETVLLVPQAAVQEQMGEFYVYVVEGEEAKEVKIKPGKSKGGYLVVLEGLKEGQEIVVKGIQKVGSGDKIKVLNQEVSP
ncbi:efflux RND transporter periplasmic adaptor subunit [Pararhodonellum marinum]|uniref:efflux RND transporter periplasmic adaptor subunit n=1 Tax=Pararhodonellum marinum TaxID=2755358 RepID=UPI0018900902|nr:efflux RND transporter periplasmic adaptor subunit [Pararhodonellum marinum]